MLRLRLYDPGISSMCERHYLQPSVAASLALNFWIVLLIKYLFSR